MGVTVDAIRGRIRRGTLHSERESGTVYVWVGLAEADRREPSADSRGPSPDQSELIEEMRARIEDLREQLDEEREARRRADTILAQLSQANAEQARTIRAIEAPASGATEPPGGPETATEQPGRVEPQPSVEVTQEPQESPELGEDEQQGRDPVPDATGPREEPPERPWWRRMFGG
jgi:hypothetical protein